MPLAIRLSCPADCRRLPKPPSSPPPTLTCPADCRRTPPPPSTLILLLVGEEGLCECRPMPARQLPMRGMLAVSFRSGMASCVASQLPPPSSERELLLRLLPGRAVVAVAAAAPVLPPGCCCCGLPSSTARAVSMSMGVDRPAAAPSNVSVSGIASCHRSPCSCEEEDAVLPVGPLGLTSGFHVLFHSDWELEEKGEGAVQISS